MKIKHLSNEIIDLYCNKNLNTVQIANKIGCSNSAVGRLLKRNKIKPSHTPNELKLSEKDICNICDKYIKGETTIEISKLYNVSDTSIAKILKNNNIVLRKSIRRSKVKNHNYFEFIDSIDKAYFFRLDD